MTELLTIMWSVISPVLLIAGVAFVLARRFQPEPGALSFFVVYLFIPALAFQGISTTDLAGEDIIGIGVVAAAVVVLMSLVGLLVTHVLHFERQLRSAFLVCIVLMNAANYGIPLNSFAFGAAGEQRAILYYVMNVLFGTAVAIYFASRGQAGVRTALLNVLRVPIVYAALAGMLVNLLDITPPPELALFLLPFERAVNILAGAAIPGMLALLGVQLARTLFRGQWRPILLATGMRLVLGPLLALPVALLLGLQGVTFQVALVESAMPTAVLANALVTQFGGDAQFTSTVTLVSTLASIVTLSILLALLL